MLGYPGGSGHGGAVYLGVDWTVGQLHHLGVWVPADQERVRPRRVALCVGFLESSMWILILYCVCFLTWRLEVLSVEDVVEQHLVGGDPGPDGGRGRGPGGVQRVQLALHTQIYDHSNIGH